MKYMWKFHLCIHPVKPTSLSDWSDLLFYTSSHQVINFLGLMLHPLIWLKYCDIWDGCMCLLDPKTMNCTSNGLRLNWNVTAVMSRICKWVHNTQQPTHFFFVFQFSCLFQRIEMNKGYDHESVLLYSEQNWSHINWMIHIFMIFPPVCIWTLHVPTHA